MINLYNSTQNKPTTPRVYPSQSEDYINKINALEVDIHCIDTERQPNVNQNSIIARNMTMYNNLNKLVDKYKIIFVKTGIAHINDGLYSLDSLMKKNNNITTKSIIPTRYKDFTAPHKDGYPRQQLYSKNDPIYFAIGETLNDKTKIANFHNNIINENHQLRR